MQSATRVLLVLIASCFSFALIKSSFRTINELQFQLRDIELFATSPILKEISSHQSEINHIPEASAAADVNIDKIDSDHESDNDEINNIPEASPAADVNIDNIDSDHESDNDESSTDITVQTKIIEEVQEKRGYSVAQSIKTTTESRSDEKIAIVMRGMDPPSKIVLDRMIEVSSILQRPGFEKYDFYVMLDQTRNNLTSTASIQKYFDQHNASGLKGPTLFGITEKMIRGEFPALWKGYVRGPLVDGTTGACCKQPLLWQLLMPTFVTFVKYHQQYDYSWVYEDDVWSVGRPLIEIFQVWDKLLEGINPDVAGIKIERGSIPYVKMVKEKQTRSFLDILIAMKATHWQKNNKTLLAVDNQTRSKVWNTWDARTLPPWKCLTDSLYRHSRAFSNYVYDMVANNTYQFAECFQQPLAWYGGFNITDLEKLSTRKEDRVVWHQLFQKITTEEAEHELTVDHPEATALVHHVEYGKYVPEIAIVMRAKDPLNDIVLSRILQVCSITMTHSFKRYDFHLLLDQSENNSTTNATLQEYFNANNASHLKAPPIFAYTDQTIRDEFPLLGENYAPGSLLPFLTFCHHHQEHSRAWVFDEHIWTVGGILPDSLRAWDRKLYKLTKKDFLTVKVDEKEAPERSIFRENMTQPFENILISMKAVRKEGNNSFVFLPKRTRSGNWNTYRDQESLPAWTCTSELIYQHSRKFSNYLYKSVKNLTIFQSGECFQQPMAWHGRFNIIDLKQILDLDQALGTSKWVRFHPFSSELSRKEANAKFETTYSRYRNLVYREKF